MQFSFKSESRPQRAYSVTEAKTTLHDPQWGWNRSNINQSTVSVFENTNKTQKFSENCQFDGITATTAAKVKTATTTETSANTVQIRKCADNFGTLENVPDHKLLTELNQGDRAQLKATIEAASRASVAWLSAQKQQPEMAAKSDTKADSFCTPKSAKSGTNGASKNASPPKKTTRKKKGKRARALHKAHRILSGLRRNSKGEGKADQNFPEKREHALEQPEGGSKPQASKLHQTSLLENWLNDTVLPLTTAIPRSAGSLAAGQVEFALGEKPAYIVVNSNQGANSSVEASCGFSIRDRWNRRFFTFKSSTKTFLAKVPEWPGKVHAAAKDGNGWRSFLPNKYLKRPRDWSEFLSENFGPAYDASWPYDFGPAEFYKVEAYFKCSRIEQLVEPKSAIKARLLSLANLSPMFEASKKQESAKNKFSGSKFEMKNEEFGYRVSSGELQDPAFTTSYLETHGDDSEPEIPAVPHNISKFSTPIDYTAIYSGYYAGGSIKENEWASCNKPSSETTSSQLPHTQSNRKTVKSEFEPRNFTLGSTCNTLGHLYPEDVPGSNLSQKKRNSAVPISFIEVFDSNNTREYLNPTSSSLNADAIDTVSPFAEQTGIESESDRISAIPKTPLSSPSALIETKSLKLVSGKATASKSRSILSDTPKSFSKTCKVSIFKSDIVIGYAKDDESIEEIYTNKISAPVRPKSDSQIAEELIANMVDQYRSGKFDSPDSATAGEDILCTKINEVYMAAKGISREDTKDLPEESCSAEMLAEAEKYHNYDGYYKTRPSPADNLRFTEISDFEDKGLFEQSKDSFGFKRNSTTAISQQAASYSLNFLSVAKKIILPDARTEIKTQDIMSLKSNETNSAKFLQQEFCNISPAEAIDTSKVTSLTTGHAPFQSNESDSSSQIHVATSIQTHIGTINSSLLRRGAESTSPNLSKNLVAPDSRNSRSIGKSASSSGQTCADSGKIQKMSLFLKDMKQNSNAMGKGIPEPLLEHGVDTSCLNSVCLPNLEEWFIDGELSFITKMKTALPEMNDFSDFGLRNPDESRFRPDFKEFEPPKDEKKRRDLEAELRKKFDQCKVTRASINGKFALKNLSKVVSEFSECFDFARTYYAEITTNRILDYAEWLCEMRMKILGAFTIICTTGEFLKDMITTIKKSDISRESLSKLEDVLIEIMKSFSDTLLVLEQVQYALVKMQKPLPNYGALLANFARTSLSASLEILDTYNFLCVSNLRDKSEKEVLHAKTGYLKFMKELTWLKTRKNLDFKALFEKSLKDLLVASQIVGEGRENLEMLTKDLLEFIIYRKARV